MELLPQYTQTTMDIVSPIISQLVELIGEVAKYIDRHPELLKQTTL